MTVMALFQTALYTALHGDATLMSKVKGIYDYTYGTDYPYIIIGDAEEHTWDTLGRAYISSAEGYRLEETVFVVTNHTGFKESLEILVEVERILYAGITISGYSVILDSIRRITRRDDTNDVRYVQLVVTYLIQKT